MRQGGCYDGWQTVGLAFVISLIFSKNAICVNGVTKATVKPIFPAQLFPDSDF